MKVFISLLAVAITLACRQDRVHAFASSNSRTSYPSSSGLSTQEVAQQLIEENTTPYDDETVAPIESEFHSLMATFLAYSQEDIQSMTSTCNRYLHYKSNRHQSLHKDEPDVDKHIQQPRQRSDEGGIRYRALFTGVQSASMEPAVLRSFTVLFEDYLPIRIAGRRIYKHLKNVMEEVRLERIGEIERARELCSGWDWKIKQDDRKEQHCIEFARCIWDTLMDEALLLGSTKQDGDGRHMMEAGVIPFHQLRCLGLDEVLTQFDLLTDHDHGKLEYIIKQIMLEEGEGMTDPAKTQEPEKRQPQNDDAISFVEFMRLLYHLTLTSPSGSQIANDQESLTKLLQQIQQTAMSKRQSNDVKQETSILLAAKAINSGSINACKKRQKHSDQFDHYISTFQVWEDKFMGGDDARLTKQPPRRLEILRGCFEGARNEKVVAALKIVYMGKRKQLYMIEYFYHQLFSHTH